MSSALPVDAWPFLIARSRTVGQRVLLAPGFLVSAGRHVDLKASVAAAGGADGEISRSRFDVSGARYTLFFRTSVAHARMIGQEGGELTDESSRRFEVTEGVLIAGDPDGIDPLLLGEALRITGETFRAFWLADDQHAEPVTAPRLVPGTTVAVDLSQFRRRERRGPGSAPPPPPAPPPTLLPPKNDSKTPPGEEQRPWTRRPQTLLLAGIFLAVVVVIALAVG